ncbi:MAG: 16S rRNA (guanine(527)-N(7))-methyltransferase RsmG [Candidatus Izimaplasma sp.]|nr:16S rRNA (guanine(527)-N(7))-methyltransferase RsmG [Candidatus Izimaplasma bacterium]
MKDRFMKMLEALEITITDEKYEKFITFYELLVEWNEKINLTSITNFEDVFLKHFYDSLCLVKGVNLNQQSLLDVGSGAGFPSIPLKIVFEDLNITIIDSLNKRIKFLKELTKSLNIEVRLIHGRVEEHKFRNHYDIVTARAVSNMRVLAELCLPFVKVGGLFIALKGPKHKEEFEQSKKAVKILGGKLLKTIEYDIDNQKRALILISKITSSDKKYPRVYGKIKSNPL